MTNLGKILQTNVICPFNASVSHWKIVKRAAQVLNEFDFDYNSDDFISSVVNTYHEITSTESSE